MSKATHIACSECSKVVPNPGGNRKTCSEACRARRHRRLAAERKDRGAALNSDPEELKTARNGLDPEVVENVLGEILREEAKPVAREAINDKLGELIQQVVGIAPKALAALELALASSDPRVSTRAAEVLLKYTMPAADKDRDETHGQVVVNFNGNGPEIDDETGEVIEVKTCEMCGEAKPAEEFEAGDRCDACHKELTEMVSERFQLNEG